MPVPFTQYLRPNGRKVQVEIALDEETETMAKAIIASGLLFEIEVLSTGEVSATIADPNLDLDVIHATIVPNGPRVPEVIRAMIHKYHKENF